MANRNGVSAWCVGAQIDGRFELLEWRSNAGGAVVWRGKQSNAIHEAYVTIVQHPHTLRPGVLEERRREAQAASVVSSDAWVRVIGFGEWAGLSYLVADDIRGHSIEDMMRFVKEASTGALFPGVLVHIALQVLTAVERANEAGVVHGDICTGSVFYADGVAKLLFLGLARAHDHPGQPHLHMTPEQVNGAPPDPGADLWAVGVLMHCMACGSYRLKESAAGFVHDLSLEEIHAPPKLRAIIMRSLERNVQLRYRTPSEMRQDLVAAAAAMPHTGRAHSPYGITMPPSQQGTLSATLWSGAPALTPRRDGSNPATPRAAAPSVPERLTEYIAAGYRSTSSSPTKAVHEWQRVQSQSSRDAHTSCDPIKHEVTKCDAPAKLPRSVQRSGGITRDTPIPPPRAHPPSVVSHNPMHPLEVEMVIRDEAETRASGEGVDGGFLQSTLRRAAGGGGGASPRNVMPGSVGLIVTSQVPHRVLQVADMCDLNGVMQGRAGYANASVLPGDRLLAVDGVPVEWLPISKVQTLLRGAAGTRVQLDLARGNHRFMVVVMRHLPLRGAEMTPRGGREGGGSPRAERVTREGGGSPRAERVAMLTPRVEARDRERNASPRAVWDRHMAERQKTATPRVSQLSRTGSDPATGMTPRGLRGYEVVQSNSDASGEEASVLHAQATSGPRPLNPADAASLQTKSVDSVNHAPSAFAQIAACSVSVGSRMQQQQEEGEEGEEAAAEQRESARSTSPATVAGHAMPTLRAQAAPESASPLAWLLPPQQQQQQEQASQPAVAAATAGIGSSIGLSQQQQQQQQQQQASQPAAPASVVRVSRVGVHDGTNNFRSLAEAMRRVADGVVIYVASGTYEEELAANRSVDIRAEANASVVIAGYNGRPLLICCAGRVVLSGLKVMQHGGDTSLRGRETVRAIEVGHGSSLVMTGCSIRSECGVGVMVADSGVLVLQQCLLNGNGKCGALAIDGGSMTCESCELCSNQVYGLVCQSGSEATVVGSKMCNNRAVGALMHQVGTKCSLADNEVSDNGEMGIAVQDGATVKIQRVQAVGNLHAGLYTDGAKAIAKVEKSVLVGNGVRGIGVQGGSSVEALECKIARNQQEGVFVSGVGSRLFLQGSSVTDNGSKGIGVQSEGFVLVKDNKIIGNKEGGIFVCDADTLATVKGNVIARNGVRGIGVQLGGVAEVMGNTIEENAREGIYISRSGSRALIQRNHILNNAVKGVGVQYGAEALVETNTFVDNALTGLHVDGHGSRATLRDNTISGHVASVVIEQGAVTRGYNNKTDDEMLVTPRGPKRPTADAAAPISGAVHQRPMPDAVAAAAGSVNAGMRARLKELEAEESARQVTPRKKASYQALMTPRGHPDGKARVQQVDDRPSAPPGPAPGPDSAVRARPDGVSEGTAAVAPRQVVACVVTSKPGSGSGAEVRTRAAPARPAGVPVLNLARVTPAMPNEPAHRAWRAEVEGVEAARTSAFGGGAASLGYVPRIQEEISTPRGGRRSDEGLLRVARELPSPKASEGGTAVRRSGVGGGGLWSIGEEEARQEGGRGALSTPRGVDPLSLSVKSLASIFEKKASPGTPVREASPTTPSSYPNGDHFGDDEGGRAQAIATTREGGRGQSPRVVVCAGQGIRGPTLNLQRVSVSAPTPSAGSVSGSTPRGVERGPRGQEEEGGDETPRNMRDWMMMPTYNNTPRTTRSTLDQMPCSYAAHTPREEGLGEAKGGFIRHSSDQMGGGGGALRASGDARDARESPTVLPLHDVREGQGAAQAILGTWRDQVNGTLSLLSPRFR